MNQEKLVLEFVEVARGLDNLDYTECVLLPAAGSPQMADFIKRVFQLVRNERPKQLEMKH